MARDEDLLNRYSVMGTESAFSELVRRYVGFVYAICRRQLGDAQLAEDVTQSVFITLAAKAKSIGPGTVLSGWLFKTAHLTCKNALRVEARRRHYEGKAQQLMQESHQDTREWQDELEPMIDEALARLKPVERDAVLMRHVDELSLEELSAALGISQAAAHKRVSRATAKMRLFFQRGGGAVTIGAVGLLLSDRLVHAAPAHLCPQIIAAVEWPAYGPGSPAGIGASHQAPSWSGHAFLKLAAAAALGTLVVAFALLAPRTGFDVRAGLPALAMSDPGSTITVTGRVIDTKHVPQAGVDVELVSYGSSPLSVGTLIARSKTDSAGSYRFTGVPAHLTGLAVVADSGKSLGADMPSRDLILERPTSLRLRLTNSGGTPLASVAIEPLILTPYNAHTELAAINIDTVCPRRLVGVSDDHGIVSLSGLPQGYVVSFQVLDPRFVRRPADADGIPLALATESGLYSVSLPKGASIDGRLTFATGAPATGVKVGAQALETSDWGEATTDSQGSYHITGLPAGRYNLEMDETSPVLGGQWTANAIAALTVGPGQSISGQDMLLVNGNIVAGLVLERSTKKPVEGLAVGVYGPAHPESSPWVGSSTTDSTGKFSLRVPNGSQHLYLLSEPQKSLDVTVDGNRKTVVDFLVDPSASKSR